MHESDVSEFPTSYMVLNAGLPTQNISDFFAKTSQQQQQQQDSEFSTLYVPKNTDNINGLNYTYLPHHQAIVDTLPAEAAAAGIPEGGCITTNNESDGQYIHGLVVDDWTFPYTMAEIIWGFILVLGIFIVNSWILWVVGKSRELWKPRHLWMACLCITDLFVGAHKVLELLLLFLPGSLRFLCVIGKTTLGIPYVVNMLLLTLLSLDRFIAVGYPFFYSSSVSNKHVGIGFLLVILTGFILAGASVALGLSDPICRPHNLQLVYLTIVLTLCSILTLLFNSFVLRIAKKQLSAIYAHEPSLRGRRVSVVCTNCGCKNETFVKTLIPLSAVPISNTKSDLGNTQSPTCASKLLPLNDTVVLGPLDLGLNMTASDLVDGQCCMNIMDHVQLGLDSACPHESHLMDEAATPLVRAVSLPTMSDSALPVPISLVVQADPTLPPTMVLGNVTSDIDGSCKLGSMGGLERCPTPQVAPVLPRSRSLVSCRTHRVVPPTIPRLQLFRNLHFARAHMFQVGRLFPSIRFARTVLLIMIPMWVFILPIVTIIPLHRTCTHEENTSSPTEFNCATVETLWNYLLVHMRSVLPLQAILDTLIYAFGSKEFRQALQKIMKRRRSNSSRSKSCSIKIKEIK